MTDIDKTKLAADTAALDDFNRGIVEEFRANGGKVGGPFEGGTLLLLHTTGAKSGQPRLSPLAYLTVDGKMLIVGSYAGAPKHPAWVHNLRANPRAPIEVGTESYDVERPRTAGRRARRDVSEDHRDRTGLRRVPGQHHAVDPAVRADPRLRFRRRDRIGWCGGQLRPGLPGFPCGGAVSPGIESPVGGEGVATVV